MSGLGWLSGQQIVEERERGTITIAPFSRDQVNPNSYNYQLGGRIKRLTSEVLDFSLEDEFEELTVPDSGMVLRPGECYLGYTVEVFGSAVFASLITGRSSVGRKFVTNHVTAGLIDIGFFGQLTLEITVQRPVRVYPNVCFGQIFWFSVMGLPAPQYEGKYLHQEGPTASLMHHGATG